VLIIYAPQSTQEGKNAQDVYCHKGRKRSALNLKGLKGDERKAEYQKCFLDPINYK
jgi:hypothetical protein